MVKKVLAALTELDVIRHAIGLGSLGLVIFGIYGLLGRDWAAIAAGLLPLSFYIYGEVRAAKPARAE
jgi:hypothetical protein